MKKDLGALRNAVLFSLPGSESFYLGHQNDNGFSDKPSRDTVCFAIQPFAKSLGARFIHLQVCQVVSPSNFTLKLNEPQPIESIAQQAYLELVQKAIAACTTSSGKVVLSKPSSIDLAHFDPIGSMLRLREVYPDAFVYLLISEEFGHWMGASPEALVRKEGPLFSTMALAGTRWGEELFTQKEFDEQMLVTKDILGKLEGNAIEVSDVYERPYGQLRHLCTDFRWEVEDKDTLYFADLLHPTPAVCGYPASEAESFINQHEGYDRALYTGYLGVIGLNEMDHLFVNLRCMQLFRNRVVIYSGGGINQKSDPAAEWDEVERKKNAVLSNLVYG